MEVFLEVFNSVFLKTKAQLTASLSFFSYINVLQNFPSSCHLAGLAVNEGKPGF